MTQALQQKKLLKTAKEVRTELSDHGVTITAWAKANGFDARLVKEVLYERTKGRYGKAHDIAVALGIKANPGPKPAFLLRRVA